MTDKTTEAHRRSGARPDVLAKVRKIEIKARGLSQQMFSGEYHSAFKGRGMAFSEVREYQYGDDVRNIDWNVTARLAHPYVKVFEEERELTVMLLVDVSGSGDFGTVAQSKTELAAEVAATLAFSAIANNDKVGVILFSDRIERFIPPKKGRQHTLRIISDLISYEPEGHETSLRTALEYFQNMVKRRCTAFLISDMHDHDYERALRLSAHKHDMTVLRLADRREEQMPNIGLVPMRDPESGRTEWIDTGSLTLRREFDQRAAHFATTTDANLERWGIDHCTLHTGEDYVKPLRGIFARRG